MSATSFLGSSPSLPLERERETLENAGHVSPRIWKMTKHYIEGGLQIITITHDLPAPPSKLCFVFSQILGGEDPGNEVAASVLKTLIVK